MQQSRSYACKQGASNPNEVRQYDMCERWREGYVFFSLYIVESTHTTTHTRQINNKETHMQ